MLIETLKHIQARDNLTDQQFADKIGIHRVSWNKIKNYRKPFGNKFLKHVSQSFPILKKAIDNYMLGDIAIAIIHGSPERYHISKWRAFWDYCDGIYQRVLDIVYDWAKR